MVTALLALLLIVMVCMVIRDGRPFFADFLKVSALILTVLLAVLTWLPFPYK